MDKEVKILDWFFTAGMDDIAGETPLNFYETGRKGVVCASETTIGGKLPPFQEQRQTVPADILYEKAKSDISPSLRSGSFFPQPSESSADRTVFSDSRTEEGASFLQTAEQLSVKAQTLEQLRENLQAFDGCALKKTAMNTVFGVGPKDAPIMFIGEAPGADEDRQGIPFVGVSGQLLDKMLSFIGVSREKNAYISNIIPWRPPGNRKPSTLEIELCLPFILRHIELVNPKIIVCVGGTSVTSLLQTGETITRVRGQWRSLKIGSREIPLMPIFHPAFLLRSPAYKKTTWQDLLELKRKLNELELA